MEIEKSIKKVLIVYLLLFIMLFTYIGYFEVFKAKEAVESTFNSRLWVKRAEILRGTIYDRNMEILTSSKKINDKKFTRQYLGGEYTASILGYIDEKYGITGIEKQYDSILSEDELDIKETISGFAQGKDKKGHNIVTTLDMDLQKISYDLLGNNKGSVVCINPKTGEVLAMVSKPSFNPNKLQENWAELNKNAQGPFINRAIEGLYPPGSIFKTITLVSSIENIAGVEKQKFLDNGKLKFNDKEFIENYNGAIFGNIDINQAFYKSSNVVFGGLGLELKEKLYGTSEKFYFNKKIESPDFNIKTSSFPKSKEEEPGNLAQSSIGQGQDITTPIHMALVAASIANGGVMMKPFIVSKVLSSDNSLYKEYKGEVLTTVTTPEVGSKVKTYMRNVVLYGTAKNAEIKGLEICGKTGTADFQKGGVDMNPHSWFIGFAPLNNPDIALAVIIEESQGEKASTIASKIINSYKK